MVCLHPIVRVDYNKHHEHLIPNGPGDLVTEADAHPVADGLIRLSALTQSVFTRTAERHGLPAAQARLLCMLAAGPRRMSDLAGLLGIERAALTGLADRAERRGLVARTAVPGDRRAGSVAPTPEGGEGAGGVHPEIFQGRGRPPPL